MVHVVTGGSGSGKSEYAERIIAESGISDRFYVATMESYGKEAKIRIARHQALRAGKGFCTIECPRKLDEISFGGKACRAVLVECMSNLTANEWYACMTAEENQGSESGTLVLRQERADRAFEWIKKGILHLRKQSGLLVIVTNEVFSDGGDYGWETKEYIRLLGQVNCWLSSLADQVTEVVYGIPLQLK